LLSLAVSQGATDELLHLGGVIGAFVAGAAFSGFLIQHSTLKLGRRYGAALLVESVLLGCAAAMMKSHGTAGSYFASAACGLQNAMAGTYSGALVRTTHLTGMFTDLGAALGHFARGIQVDWLRVRLCLTIIVSFAIGGVIGAWLFDRLQYDTLYAPAALTGVVGTSYIVYAHRKRVNGVRADTVAKANGPGGPVP
jgi:uncharacterized membrane protein YoaK (UPF0700 family)